MNQRPQPDQPALLVDESRPLEPAAQTRAGARLRDLEEELRLTSDMRCWELQDGAEPSAVERALAPLPEPRGHRRATPAAAHSGTREQEATGEEMTTDHHQTQEEASQRAAEDWFERHPDQTQTFTTADGTLVRHAIVTHSVADLVAPGEKVNPFAMRIIPPAPTAP